MDFTQVSGDESECVKAANKVTPGEEYDPSHPLDSSDEEEEQLPCPLTFATSDNVNNVGVPSTTSPVGDKSVNAAPKGGGQPSSTTGEVQQQLSSTKSVGETLKTANTGGSHVGSGVKEPEIDLSSIPMPSDEYRRPTIQFSIPTRHRLMSISSLIKRQKGVVKKQDKDGGSSICYNSEVSKAFNKADGDVEGGDDERPKVSLVQEIFGSDDEENAKDQEDITQSPEDQQGDVDSNRGEGVPSSSGVALEGDSVTSTGHDLVGGSSETAEDGSRWKTLDKSGESGESNEAVSSGGVAGGPDSHEEDENSREEIRISIKPTSELLEAPGNDNSSEGEEPEVIIEESVPDACGENDNSRGKENKQIILECVSDEEPDFEVTFVGIRRTNVSNLRNKQGQSRLPRRNAVESSPPPRKRSSSPPRKRLSSSPPRKRSSSPPPRKRSSSPPPRKRSSSPLNGFEEGEIVEMADRKKKKAKKKKTKKRKRSKDSRISSSKASERSTMDSPEKNKSFSENSDSKEVSWRKPKMAKSRNYRNGKRESPDKPQDRASRNDDSYRRRSPGRYSSANERLKSRRQRSLSNSRFRSRSRSSSRSSPTRWDGRSRVSRLGHRGESHRSRSSISNHSSPSFSRSRSLTKKRGKRRHSPSPAKRHKNGRSASKSPPRPSKSPRLSKRHRTNGTEATKRDKLRERSPSPSDTHTLKKTAKPKVDEPVNEESKKKSKKEKIATDDTDKEKRKKRKRKEKSLSPVKAIVADGDSIVVSLSFQKAKEEVPKTPKVTPPAKSESSSEKSKTTNNGNNSECSDDEDSSEKEESTKQSSPKKSTFTINLDLDGSPHERRDCRRSPDIVVLEENNESSKKSENKKAQEQKADGIKNSSTGSSSQRMDGLDFVSSSHECSVDATQNIFPSPGDPKATPSSAERNSTSKSPYKFSEYFVSSTCGDIGKSSSPVVELSSPRVYTSGKPNDSSGTSFLSKNRDSSPFSSADTGRSVNSCNNGMDKLSPPSPEPLHSSSTKGGMNSTATKPMIGNIPGLFPSGFSSSLGGIGSAPPVVIPAPPRIIPNTSTSNLINPNVLVSVASALYAPLLAAKQHGTSASMGQSGGNVNLQRHGSSTSAFFQKSLNSHSQPFGLYNNRTRNGPGDQGGEGGDSPFSPNSSDGDDLFEPPGDGNNAEGNNSSRKMGEHHQSGSGNSSGSPQFGKYQNEGNRNEKQGLFDTLFSTAPKKATSHSKHSKKKTSSHMKKSRPKSKNVKDKRPEPEKNSEGTEVTSRLNEEVPVSAVALKMKEKYLKKLNRQERVVEEVKLCLKPHYSKKHVNKEEYKEILRKAVPKICHNKSGEINPNKIKELVEAYVKKFRRARKSENSAA